MLAATQWADDEESSVDDHAEGAVDLSGRRSHGVDGGRAPGRYSAAHRSSNSNKQSKSRFGGNQFSGHKALIRCEVRSTTSGCGGPSTTESTRMTLTRFLGASSSVK